jgi:excisionase family DNA binding protein
MAFAWLCEERQAWRVAAGGGASAPKTRTWTLMGTAHLAESRADGTRQRTEVSASGKGNHGVSSSVDHVSRPAFGPPSAGCPGEQGGKQRVPTDGTSGSRALLVTAEEAARLLAVGRTTVYALLGSGDLKSVQIGRSRRIRLSDLETFVQQLDTFETADHCYSGDVGSDGWR